MVCRIIRVKGKVQGVYFRYHTLQKANEIGLKGFVRNEPDGSVYIEAEGEEFKVFELEKWCHNGPPAASVKEVVIEDSPIQNYMSFEIRR